MPSSLPAMYHSSSSEKQISNSEHSGASRSSSAEHGMMLPDTTPPYPESGSLSVQVPLFQSSNMPAMNPMQSYNTMPSGGPLYPFMLQSSQAPSLSNVVQPGLQQVGQYNPQPLNLLSQFQSGNILASNNLSGNGPSLSHSTSHFTYPQTDPRMNVHLQAENISSNDVWSPESRSNFTLTTFTAPGGTIRRLYVCNYCRKEFVHKSALTSHLRVHTGERPFSCDTCGRRFSQKNNLVRHQKLHTGQRPFECTLCDKRFSRKSHLERHERTHNELAAGDDNNVPKQATNVARDSSADDATVLSVASSVDNVPRVEQN